MKNKKKGRSKRKLTPDQAFAYNSVSDWVSLGLYSDSEFVLNHKKKHTTKFTDKILFELHSHSTCSDGFLSPTRIVERAHANGVKVLSLTDHDTLSGIPEALEAAQRFGIKIIPGVEISTYFSLRESASESVHILAYYGVFGPSRFDEVQNFLSNIRDGRFVRAKNIVAKLNSLQLPLEWDHVARIAGKGTAPGRLHIARAMVGAGLVENLKHAFSRYLNDDGPAYFKGSEPLAEDAVQFICETVFNELANSYSLVKLGGSDYHAKGGQNESDLGSANLPMSIHNFLKVARPIWYGAILDILKSFTNESSQTKYDQIKMFGTTYKGTSRMGMVEMCLSCWLTSEERQNDELEALSLKLSNISMCNELIK